MQNLLKFLVNMSAKSATQSKSLDGAKKDTKSKQKIVSKRGTEIILDVLVEQGCKKIYGYPGGCVIPLFDEILNYSKEIDMILVRHEQGATHAADGEARITGKAGVVIVTSGPGATNTLTGIATAMMDSIPMVVITGQVKRHLIGTDAFQETNVVGVSRPITKHNYLVKDIANLRKTLREAFFIAESGRPGPVLVDVPVDLQKEVYDFVPDYSQPTIRGYQTEVDTDKVTKGAAQAWKLITESKKPLLYIGGGVILSNAASELKKFVDKTEIPVSTTLLGQGAFPESSPHALGMLGMHGTYTANRAMMWTDLAIAIGSRFDDRVTSKTDEFLADAKIIHADIDPSSIGKIKVPDVGVVADAKSFLQELNKIAHKLPIEEWNGSLKNLKEKYPPPNYDDVDTDTDKLRPEYIIRKLSKITQGEAVVVTDVGQHQMFVCLHYEFKHPRSELTSGGLGTMGYSLPAAMGAALHVTDRPVISISGDGGFQMNMQELATIRTYNIPVKIIIFNNKNLGMVKQWQDFFWDQRYSSVIFDQNPDFIKLSDAFDIPAEIVREKNDVALAINRMLDTEGPYLVEFRIDKDAHVFPMIPSGESLSSIILGPKE